MTQDGNVAVVVGDVGRAVVKANVEYMRRAINGHDALAGALKMQRRHLASLEAALEGDPGRQGMRARIGRWIKDIDEVMGA